MSVAPTPALVQRPFGSVLTAMVTPFTPDGELDLDSARSLARHLVDHGNDGIVVSGTTGESPTTTDAEKDALLRAVIDEVGDRAHVVAGVGTNVTSHTIDLAQQAQSAGADGLLVVTPYYNKPPASSLIAHFSAVADATPLPNVLYDIPGRAGVRITTPVLQELSQHERIIAVKDATGDVVSGQEVMATTDLAFYCGDDALNLAWLAVGASGVISVVGHVASQQYQMMTQAIESADLAVARAVHQHMIPVVKTLMSPSSQGAIQSKAAMQLMGVIKSRATRLPYVPATDDEVAHLRDVLSSANLLEGQQFTQDDAAHDQGQTAGGQQAEAQQ